MNETLIPKINQKVKEIKAEEERKSKALKELKERENNEKERMIKEIKGLFRELEPYRYIVEITDWQTLQILGRWLFIKITCGKTVEIWADNVEDSNYDVSIFNTEINQWSYDAVKQLYDDRFLVLEAIAAKIGL